MNKQYPSAISDLIGGPTVDYGEPSDTQKTPFITVENGIIQSSPLGDDQFFDADYLKNLIYISESRLVHAPSIDTAVEVGGVATASLDLAAINANPNNGGRAITGAPFPFAIIQISTPQLNALPAGVISVNMTVPFERHGTVALGQLDISQANVTNRVNITLIPWIVTQSKPRPTMGMIRSGQALSAVVSGLAAGSQVSLIVPGTTHKAIFDTLARIR